MPSTNSVDSYKRFMQSGICDCGKHMDAHRSTIDVPRTDANDCALTQDVIYAWHTPRADFSAG